MTMKKILLSIKTVYCFHNIIIVPLENKNYVITDFMSGDNI